VSITKPRFLIGSPRPAQAGPAVWLPVTVSVPPRPSRPIKTGLSNTRAGSVGGGEARSGYSVTVPYSVTQAGDGTIEVFESSAKDGSPVNVEQIPVTLGLSDADLGGERQGR
jgi:hypothetical protein